MTTLKMLFPIRAMIPCDVPQADRPAPYTAVLDGRKVRVLDVDDVTGEAHVEAWQRVGGVVEASREYVPLARIEVAR